MEILRGYDKWKTTPPEPEPLTFAKKLELKRAELENELPPTVCLTISGYAYEKVHWSDEQEVNQLFCELGELILDALKKDDLI